MSNISDRHVFSAYVSAGANKSAALSGQRLSVVRFKKDKSGNKAKESQCVSVPRIDMSEVSYDMMKGWFQQYLESVQDEIIRDACVANKDAVTSDDIDIMAINSYLVQQSQGERLNGEQIKYWFDCELQDVLMVAFADKMGIGDSPSEQETSKLQQMCNVYRDCFAAMAGGRMQFPADKRAKLEKALSLADCTDGIGQKLSAKLQAMKEVTVEEMLGL